MPRSSAAPMSWASSPTRPPLHASWALCCLSKATSGHCNAATCNLRDCNLSATINPLACRLSSREHESTRSKAHDSYTTPWGTILLPAQLLEKRAPSFKNKGRIRVGADADITVFDPNRVIDRATFEEPLQYSDGIQFVLVNGVPVVKDGQLVEGVYPGREARAPMSQ